MRLSRRSTLAGMAFAMAMPAAAKPTRIKDLQAEFDKASEVGEWLSLPAGDYAVAGLRIGRDMHIAGVPGRTRLVSAAGGPILTISDASRVSLSGLSFVGDAAAPSQDNEAVALVMAGQVAALDITDCSFETASLTGLKVERCGGRIANNRFAKLDAAIFALDSAGLIIDGNRLDDMGNNGILVWTSTTAEDGTLVRGNRIGKVGARKGGSGEYGNGIGVFRAGNVTVAENHISDCAFSAIRNNSGSACQIVNNTAQRLGEVALYCEFGFEGAVITGNIVDGCAHGISITNFNDGGRLAVCSGNIIRRAARIGISAEADTTVSGNVVSGSQGPGISLGWGAYGRNLIATGNVVQNCYRGIVFSAVDGAGPVMITGNRISASIAEAIAGMDHDTVITPDLSREGQTAPGQSLIASNLVT
jgi:uncharacterized secreted repeat protein (TIGR03808 family)